MKHVQNCCALEAAGLLFVHFVRSSTTSFWLLYSDGWAFLWSWFYRLAAGVPPPRSDLSRFKAADRSTRDVIVKEPNMMAGQQGTEQ